MGSELYERTIEWSKANLDDEGHELTRLCWDDRPWMINAYTGSLDDDRELKIIEWCREQFGDEAWPIHGRPGNWYRGGATVFGWTHIGFATEGMMNSFIEAWPSPDNVERSER